METLLQDNRSEYTSIVIRYRKTRFTHVCSTEFKALHYNPQCDNTSFKIHRSTRASSNAASILVFHLLPYGGAGRLLLLGRIRGHRHKICWRLDNAYNFISQASRRFRHGQSFTEVATISPFPTVMMSSCSSFPRYRAKMQISSVAVADMDTPESGKR